MRHPNCLHPVDGSCVFCSQNESAARQTFEAGADATLEIVRSTYTSRGLEYADSWAPENQVATFTKSTLAAFGLDLLPAQIRLLQLAALVDVKDSRLAGPFKADSVIDGIAYRSLYCALRAEYESNRT